MTTKQSNSKLIAALKDIQSSLPPQPWNLVPMGEVKDYEERLELVRLIDADGINLFESWPESQSVLVGRVGTAEQLVRAIKSLPTVIAALEADE